MDLPFEVYLRTLSEEVQNFMSVQRADKNIVDPEWANVFLEDITLEETLEQILAHIPIFSLLTGKELSKLARIVYIRRFDPGETIIYRGVEQSGFYLIRLGSVHIVREHLDHTREVVGKLGPSELLGEFALLDNTPRTSSVVAAEASELIGFFKPDLMEILVTNPTLGCKILLRLAEEMSRKLIADYGTLQDLGYPFPETVDASDALAKDDPTL